jgi:hypothetical protein
MPSFRTLSFLFLVTTLPGADPKPAVKADADETLVMDRFVVQSTQPYFNYHVFFAMGSDRVESARVTWAGSLLQKADLRIGDDLVAVDDIPVEQYLRADLQKAIEGELGVGKSRSFSFSGYRGVFHEPHTIKFVMGRTAPPTSVPDVRQSGQPAGK